MRRQFVRVYVGMAAVLVLAALAASLVLDAMRRSSIDRWIEEMSRPLVADIREQLDLAGGDSDRAVEAIGRLRDTRPGSIRVRALEGLQLSAADRDRLIAGEVVISRTGRRRHQILALLDSAQVAVLDPVPWGRRRPDGRGDPMRRRGPGPRPPGGVMWNPLIREYWSLGALLVILVLIGAAIYVLIRPLERRVYGLSEAAERFGGGDLSARAEVKGGDAIAELARTFNGMADQIEGLVGRQQELLRAVSHELRTPLARLFFLLDDAQTATESEARDASLGRIERTMSEMNDLVEELLTFVRLDGEAYPPDAETVDVPTAIAEILDQVSELRCDVVPEVACERRELVAAPLYFRRAVRNLVTNALRHARGRVRISCRAEGPNYHLSVEDDGPGVPEAVRDRIFEPFYREDDSRDAKTGGTGLGLAIVKRVMASQGGTVSVDDSPLGGARFTLTFAEGVAPPGTG